MAVAIDGGLITPTIIKVHQTHPLNTTSMSYPVTYPLIFSLTPYPFKHPNVNHHLINPTL